ncbi:MAG: hypothetical protein ACO1RX_19330 [Candidatus Sericytochromatia bacterium]
MNGVQFQTRLQPVFFLGDSHCAIFNHLLFEIDSPPGWLLTRALYLSDLRADNFTGPDGQLAPPVYQALRQAQLLFEAQPGQAADRLKVQQLLLGQSWQPPELVICCGYGDLFALMRQLNTRFDVVSSPHEPWAESMSRSPQAQLLPVELVQQQIRTCLQPLAQGLRRLQDLGWRLWLHDLPPPTPDDADFFNQDGFLCPLALRTRLTRLFNQELADLAQTHQLGWIALWDQVTTPDQRLDVRYRLDGVHLNRAAAELSIAQLCLQRSAQQQASSSATLNGDALFEAAARLESLQRGGHWDRLETEFQALAPHLPPSTAGVSADARRLLAMLLQSAARAKLALGQPGAAAQVLAPYRELLQAQLGPRAARPAAAPAWIWLAGQQPSSDTDKQAPWPATGAGMILGKSLTQLPWPSGAEVRLQEEANCDPQQLWAWLSHCGALGWRGSLPPAYFDAVLLALIWGAEILPSA